MKNVSTILLAIDGDYDDHALLDEVKTIVQGDSANVTVLSVMDPPPRGDPDENPAEFNLYEWAAKNRSVYVDDLSASLAKLGVQVFVKHTIGTPYLQIIRESLDHKYDLVVKPAKQESGLKQFLIRGSDIQLLSLCPTPVWIFQSTASRALKKIAVAVDLQPDDREKMALADSVLLWGKNIATSVGAELHVIHAWSLYRESTLHSRPCLAGTVQQLLISKERTHRKWLKDALGQAAIAAGDIREHLVKGEAKQLIPELASTLGVDLLIMGTVGRTGIPGFLIGNTAEAVLRKVSCSVLAIKPEEFSTPVDTRCTK